MCLDSYRAVCSKSADLEFVSLYFRKTSFPQHFSMPTFLHVIGSFHMVTCPETILESCFYLPYCYWFDPVTFNLGDCISTPKTCLNLFFKVYFPIENFITIYRFPSEENWSVLSCSLMSSFLCSSLLPPSIRL